MSDAKAHELIKLASDLASADGGDGLETGGDDETVRELAAGPNLDLALVRDIRVDPKFYGVQQLIDMIASNDIDLMPSFHRKLVWDNVQRSRLIESLLLGLPVQPIYVSATPDGRLLVVDGLQRLVSMYDFVRADFRLENLQYLRGNCSRVRLLDLDEIAAITADRSRPGERGRRRTCSASARRNPLRFHNFAKDRKSGL